MGEQILIRIPKPTKLRLKKEAEKRQMSLSDLIRQAILDYLKERTEEASR